MIDAYFFKIFIKAKRPILPLKKKLSYCAREDAVRWISAAGGQTRSSIQFSSPFFPRYPCGKTEGGKIPLETPLQSNNDFWLSRTWENVLRPSDMTYGVRDLLNSIEVAFTWEIRNIFGKMCYLSYGRKN